MQPINIITAMTEKPNKLDFTLPGMVKGTVGSIVSPGGTGKSALALQVGAQVAGGPDLLWMPSAKGKAVYIPAEDPEIAIRHRLYALGEQSSPEHRKAMHENLLIYPLSDYKPNIADPKWVEALTKLAEGAEIMILDTLRMFHDLDENDGGQMGLVISNMKQIASKTGCSIVFVHHTTKSSALNGQGAAQQASRGSSVLTDNIRWQSYLSGMSEDEAHKLGICGESRGRYVKFGVSKQNFGKPFDEIWMERRSAIDPDVEAGYTLNTLNLNPAPIAGGGSTDEFED